MENNHFVNAVQEFRPEELLHFGKHLVLHRLVCFRVVHVHRGVSETEAALFIYRANADVRRHDDNRVAEINHAPLRIGKASVFQNLKKDIENVGVRFLDLVEKHHAIRIAANGFG